MVEITALERLRAHIETEVSDGLQKLCRFRGNDWSELTVAEEEVFEIRLEDMPRLVAVIFAFDGAVGLINAHPNNDPALTAAVRDELPIIARAIEFKNARGYLSFEFILCWREFAELFGISHRLAFAFYWKLRMHEMRYGHLIISGDYERPYRPQPTRAEINPSDDAAPF